MVRKLPENATDEWTKEKGYVGEYFSYVLHTEGVDNDLFHIGQRYGNVASEQVICSQCKNDKFYVGRSSYYTAIKCTKCECEMCIHDG